MTDYLGIAEIILRMLEKSNSKPTARRGFSKSIKAEVKRRQNYRCNDCGKKSDIWDFDHTDGNSSNNSLDNCQALCPNCHAKKSRKIKQRKLKLSKVLRVLRQLK